MAPEAMTRPVFGLDRDPGVTGEMAERSKSGTPKRNPVVAALGPGPEGRICRDCSHLFRVGGVAGRYYKCDLRKVTSGAATDHRVRWPSCAAFEERT